MIYTKIIVTEDVPASRHFCLSQSTSETIIYVIINSILVKPLNIPYFSNLLQNLFDVFETWEV